MRSKKRIVYGIQGEGRGHATRSVPVIKALEKMGYELLVLASKDALPILEKNIRSEVIEIPSLSYSYANLKLSYLLSLLQNAIPILQLFLSRGRNYKYVERIVADFEPDLILSDYEQYSARIAQKKSIYLVSMDHGGVLTEAQLPKLRWHPLKAGILRLHSSIRYALARPNIIITPSFCPLEKKESSSAYFVGHIIRDEIKTTRIAEQNHVTVYLKRSIYLEKLLNIFEQIDSINFEVFSDFSESELAYSKMRHIQLSTINKGRFITSLATSRAVICTAGNQTLGESIYLQKPVLAFPEPRVIEQEVNAAALVGSGWGMYADLKRFDTGLLLQFLGNIELYKTNIHRFLLQNKGYDATDKVVNLIAQA